MIEVLDARIPYSSENFVVAKLRGDRLCIQPLNKEDLADPDMTAQWLRHIETRPGFLAMSHQQNTPKLNYRVLERVHSLVLLGRLVLPTR